MIAALVAAVVVVLVAAVVAVRWWTWRPVIRRRVMVQIDTGQSFEGVVLSRRGPLLVLGHVKVHTEGVKGQVSTPADGRTVIERSRVMWIQVT